MKIDAESGELRTRKLPGATSEVVEFADSDAGAIRGGPDRVAGILVG